MSLLSLFRDRFPHKLLALESSPQTSGTSSWDPQQSVLQSAQRNPFQMWTESVLCVLGHTWLTPRTKQADSLTAVADLFLLLEKLPWSRGNFFTI